MSPIPLPKGCSPLLAPQPSQPAQKDNNRMTARIYRSLLLAAKWDSGSFVTSALRRLRRYKFSVGQRRGDAEPQGARRGAPLTRDADFPQFGGRRRVVVEVQSSATLVARLRARAPGDHRGGRDLDGPLARI